MGKERNYHAHYNTDRSDELYSRLIATLMRGQRYAHPGCKAGVLAAELGVSRAMLSAAIAQHTEGNFASLLNGLRLRAACRRLASPLYDNVSAEEIGLSVGYVSRQAFYTAFARVYDVTPKAYRQLKRGRKALDAST